MASQKPRETRCVNWRQRIAGAIQEVLSHASRRLCCGAGRHGRNRLFTRTTANAAITERFGAISLLEPDRDDFIAAAEVRNHCRRNGVPLDTLVALIVRLRIRHGATLLTTDLDLTHAARHCKLQVWTARAA